MISKDAVIYNYAYVCGGCGEVFKIPCSYNTSRQAEFLARFRTFEKECYHGDEDE